MLRFEFKQFLFYFKKVPVNPEVFYHVNRGAEKSLKYF